ncbi:PucR family transcriptional regulator [Bifidobacterium aquikefiri]|uniref:PucR family transcriptional regulator n=1 Tax=Bifidobacterium aquikefiri TaxID=1653207 RepID=UPI0039EB4D27
MSRPKSSHSGGNALAKVARDAAALFNPDLRKSGQRSAEDDAHRSKKSSSSASISVKGTAAGGKRTDVDTAAMQQTEDTPFPGMNAVTVADDAQKAEEAANGLRLKTKHDARPKLPKDVEQALSKALGHLDHDLDWYKNLSATDKNLLTLIIRTAVADFIAWMTQYRKSPDSATGPRPSSDHIFFVAPLEFTKAISLHQALEVTRFIVDILERNVEDFAEKGNEQEIRNGMLYYAREVAFSAASVYATSAEARGDWDARIETLTIEDLIDGVIDHQVVARMSMLGWPVDYHCFAIIGRLADTTEMGSGITQRRMRSLIRGHGAECMMSSHNEMLITLIDPRGHGSPEELCEPLLRYFDDSPVCLGPLRSHIEGASQTIRASLNTVAATPALVRMDMAHGIPRPLRADDALPERALFGDDEARDELYTSIYKTLRGDDLENPLLNTLQTFLLSGSSLEITARELNVHPNTVRYRLKRSIEITGWDPMNPREAYVLLTAVKIGLIMDARNADTSHTSQE